MDYQKYMNMPNAGIPEDVAEKLARSGGIHAVSFEDKNALLEDKIQSDIGYTRLSNGDYLVSVEVNMPGVTKEMVDWWFWWHPLEKERYMLWYPGEHFGIGYAKENADYFQQKEQPPFEPNTHYPVERIGGMKMPLCIKFVAPEQFGYDSRRMRENHVATIVCGHVGTFKDRLPHTEMSHIFFQEEGGLRMTGIFGLVHVATIPSSGKYSAVIRMLKEWRSIALWNIRTLQRRSRFCIQNICTKNKNITSI